MDGLTPEQARLRGRARGTGREAAAQAAETDRTEQYPWTMVRRMTEAGFMGMTIPRAWGGAGLLPRCRAGDRGAVEGLRRLRPHRGRDQHGRDRRGHGLWQPEQKRLAADLVLAGDKPAICITEPEAGSAPTT